MRRCIEIQASPVLRNRTRDDRETTPPDRAGPAAAAPIAHRSAAARLARAAAAGTLLFFSGAAGAQEPPSAAPPSAPTVAEAEAMEARLQAAIQVNPNLAPLHASLGELYRSQARMAEARDELAEAVRLEPMSPEYRRQLGQAHLALDEHVDAEVHFAWGTELSPLDPAMYIGLGEALLEQGHFADAEAALERAAELDPESADVARLLALASSEGQSETPGPSPNSVARGFGRFLTYLFAVALTIAGLGLVLPVGSAVVALVLLLPRAVLQRRKS